MTAEPFRLLVTGSRSWQSPDLVRSVLIWTWQNDAREGPMVVVHGAARGADSYAKSWALAMGRHDYPVTEEAHPANWERDGRRAGYARNEEMVTLGADLCLAFVMSCDLDGRCRQRRPHGTHGAEHCARKAAAAGIEVRRITP